VYYYFDMGETIYITTAGLEVLHDVLASAATAHTRRGLTHLVGESLLKHLPVAWFELGWYVDETGISATTLLFSKGPDVRESTRNLRGTETLRLIRDGKVGFETSASAERVLVIPLVDPDGARGYARLSFKSSPDESLLSDPVVELLAGILAFAQRHCRLVERIAKLSSTAHQESQGLREELRKYTEADGIVARSDAMRRVLDSADLVAGHDATVLLRGESGTGKELLARRIHRLSRRARQPFVSVNCGALPETLIESELFGHERGDFTGASGRHRGRFERANNGTIFLDEVAELPPSVQVKLLRVLQEGEFERLGGEETIRVNVRVLAATHQPLERMMERGTFRADLFYRLNVFPIVIPPLRERTEDIPALARALLGEISQRLGCRIPPIRTTALTKLVDHPWRGNVRELANTLERELIVSRGRELEFSELAVPRTPDASNAEGTSETFSEGARRTILKALKACGGKVYGKQGAASRLGIPPSTLQGKMRRLQIKRRDYA
jgi:transcriptional regulator with GAF, ATPase, and Fis domain